MDKLRFLLSGSKNCEFYVDAVNRVGGIAVAKYLPEVDTDYDGLILCGGDDMDPSYYGEAVNGSVKIDHERDRAEFALLRAFVDVGKPVLGICRGLQLINVFFGGSLYQDMDNAKEHSTGVDYRLIHGVRAVEGSVPEKLYGGQFVVNSYHHQGVKTLGKGLNVTMTALGDGLVEGFVHELLPIFAVQWHPEQMCFSKRREDTVDGRKIFDYFLQMCAAHRKEKT